MQPDHLINKTKLDINMNMNTNTLELSEATGNFPLANEPSNLLTATSPETRPPTAAARKSQLAKWLLPPLVLCVSVMLFNVVLVAADLLRILNELYASGNMR